MDPRDIHHNAYHGGDVCDVCPYDASYSDPCGESCNDDCNNVKGARHHLHHLTHHRYGKSDVPLYDRRVHVHRSSYAHRNHTIGP